jgi:hypothetical protein
MHTSAHGCRIEGKIVQADLLTATPPSLVLRHAGRPACPGDCCRSGAPPRLPHLFWHSPPPGVDAAPGVVPMLLGESWIACAGGPSSAGTTAGGGVPGTSGGGCAWLPPLLPFAPFATAARANGDAVAGGSGKTSVAVTTGSGSDSGRPRRCAGVAAGSSPG